MKIWIERDADAMSARAAELIAEELRRNPGIVLGLATGSTPLGLYRRLAKRAAAGELTFADATTFNLDEYIGLSPDHPQSYRTFMEQQLFRHLDIPAERTHIPRGDADDPAQHCEAYEERIAAAGGIDLQVLGIGRNGHIGFNEPGGPFGKRTHVVALTDSTRQANARFFASLEEVPTHAITMGLKSIMNARRIILLASGPDKSLAVEQALCGDVVPEHPASILQLHPNCTFILDEAAASRLPCEVGAERRETHT